MGIVYLAEQERPVRRRVALKLVRPELDSREILARFESERQALALMDHPGIAKVFDAGATEDGRPYFVMEHVAGMPITEYCDQQRLAYKHRLTLFAEVCEAIQHAHTKGIVHRDIKPTNVLVANVDGTPRPKVIDFGVAKALNQTLTERTLYTAIGVLIGTPAYMSPEQATPDPMAVDTRTDVYSLGVLLYALLTGSPPFEAKRLRDAGWAGMLRIIQEEDPPRPSDRVTLQRTSTCGAAARTIDRRRLARVLRGDLDWITLKALDKQRSRRYQSAQALADDVRHHLAHEPVTAGPPTPWYRLTKLAQRHKAASAAAVVALLALFSASTVITVFYFRAEALRIVRQQELVHLKIATGLQTADTGDPLGALPSLLDAFRLDADLTTARAHRDRIGMTLTNTLTLLEVIPAPGVTHAAFRPDGRAIAMAAAHSGVRIWSLHDGRVTSLPLPAPFTAHTLYFSPGGSRLLLAGKANTCHLLWNTAAARPLGQLCHSTPVSHAVFSHDGRLVATSASDGTFLWNALDGALLARFPGPDVHGFHPTGGALLTGSWLPPPTGQVWNIPPAKGSQPVGQFTHAAFSRSGALLTTVGLLGVTVWNTQTWRSTQAIPRAALRDPVTLSTFGQWLAAPQGDTPSLWALPSGSRAIVPSPLHIPGMLFAFSHNEDVVAAWGHDGRLAVWRPGSALPMFARHEGLLGAAFDREGRRILTFGVDGTVRLWDLASQSRVSPLLRMPGALADLYTAGTGSRTTLLSVTIGATQTDNTARLWDCATGEPLVPPLRQAGLPGVPGWSPKHHRLVTPTQGGVARVWDTRTGEASAPTLHFEGIHFPRAYFAAEGQQLVIVDGETWTDASLGPPQLWNLQTLRRTALPTMVAPHLLAGTAFSPESHRLLTASRSGHLRLVNVRTGTSLTTALDAGSGSLAALALSADGAHAAATLYGSRIHVWNTATGHSVNVPFFHAGDWVVVSKFSTRGRWLATASQDVLSLLDVRTGRRVGRRIKGGHPMPRYNVLAFSVDDRFIAAHRGTDAIGLWAAPSGEPLAPLLRHPGYVTSVSFASSGSALLSTAADGTALAWPLVTLDWPLVDLAGLAQLFGGESVTSDEPGRPLPALRIVASWNELRARHPGVFQVAPRTASAWHHSQAEDVAELGRWSDALPHFEAALALTPTRWRLVFGRARARAELGQWDGAVADLLRAAELVPGELEPVYDAALIHLRQSRLASFEARRASLFRTWGETTNPDRARWAAHTAILAPIANHSDRVRAVAWAATALEIEPDRAERLVLHGAALLRAGRPSDALAELAKAVAMSGAQPPSSSAWLALTHRELGNVAEATKWRARAEAALQRLDDAGPQPSKGDLASEQGGQLNWEQRVELRVLLAELRRGRSLP
jgi:WD40 repeat protein/tRNA A-37 threonylcarbamoyl transferase component Bud32/Flp pilus assembly protein TadD